MKERVLLPFDDSRILSYPFVAFSYSTLKAHFGSSFFPALAKRYINCYFKKIKHRERFIPSLSDHWCENYHMIERQYVDMKRSTLQGVGIEPIEILQKCLKIGAYIYGKSQLSFVPEEIPHDKGLFWYYVIGFDDAKKVFDVRVFDNKQEYHVLQVPFSVFVDTVWGAPEHFIPFYICTVHTDIDIPLRMSDIARDLEDYVLSRTSEKIYSEDKTFGVQAIYNMNAYLYQRAKEDKFLEIYYLRALADHKYFMKERITYLVERGEISREWIPLANDVYFLSEPLVDLGVRYNQTKDFAIAEEICKRINRFMAIEKSYLPNVLGTIICYLDNNNN